MLEKQTIRVQLDFPLEQVTKPIIYHLVTDYHLVPNIRRANIDAHIGGMMVLEIDGAKDNLDAAMAYLRQSGITVTEVGTEQSWNI